ncbi:hypothetical protein F4V57_00355 [Acinetobacter qingfengensis]|uniref:Lipoprotein n=1 Tax=Acinetobacter qingfengensis TaxID=1262585 RepID=A0A1E7RDC2_9GAMM|nr:hypothetical protein [Acinetobacter qingfengensis]KAA8735290.1 hypothetical protein F4V57_00355 [Acinetobacter qingfengensis]OEY97409.1 hypothetical protein BJI46_09910 [Acinetobacter qingfengensis]
MKKYLILLLCFIGQSGWAKVPTDNQVIHWLSNKNEIVADHVSPDSAHILNTQTIRLQSGETAYLSEVEYDNAGRNFTKGYILTRPKLHESRHLKDYAGQLTEIKVLSHARTATLVQLGGAGSGQGTITQGISIVSFDGWQVKQHFDAVTLYDDSGYDENHCTSQKGSVKFEEKNARVVYSLTTQTAKDCNRPETFKSETEETAQHIDW